MLITWQVAALATLLMPLTQGLGDSYCHEDACLCAVRDHPARGPEPYPSCVSFFRTTVIPKPVTHTVTASARRAVTATVTQTGTITVTQPTTIQVSSVVVSTDAETTTVVVEDDVTTVVVVDDPVTAMVSQTETSFVTIVITDFVTSTVIAAREMPVVREAAVAACPTARTAPPPSHLPVEATVCRSTAAYWSACSCVGVTRQTTTLPPCTTTTTVTHTQTSATTITSSAFQTRTVASSATVIDVYTSITTDEIVVTATSTSVLTSLSTSTDVVSTVTQDTTIAATVTYFATTIVDLVCPMPTSFALALYSGDGTYDGQTLGATNYGADDSVGLSDGSNGYPPRTAFGLDAQQNLIISATNEIGTTTYGADLAGFGTIFFNPTLEPAYEDAMSCRVGQPDPTSCELQLYCNSNGRTVFSYCTFGDGFLGIGTGPSPYVDEGCTIVTVRLADVSS